MIFHSSFIRDILSSALVLNDIEMETMMVTSTDKLGVYNNTPSPQDVMGRLWLNYCRSCA